jgi:hypothetical protein
MAIWLPYGEHSPFNFHDVVIPQQYLIDLLPERRQYSLKNTTEDGDENGEK